MFAEDKKIITLTDKTLGENTEISLLRNSGNYSFFRNASDLIMTNLHTNPLNPCTIVAYDYYQNSIMKDKILSTELNFFDEDFHLKSHQRLIDEAQSFSDFVKQLEKPGSTTQYSSIVLPPILHLPHEELPKLRLKRHLPMSYRPVQKSQEWTTFIRLGFSATFMMLASGF